LFFRSEGPIDSDSVLDSIRDWRKRLYRAFKSSRSNDVVDFKDIIPIVVDKNRQVLLNRKLPNWYTATKDVQTFGRDPTGKVCLRRHSSALHNSITRAYRIFVPVSPSYSDYLPLSPLSTTRQAYRASNAQKVVYVPASHVTQPPPVDLRPFNISIYEVTVSILLSLQNIVQNDAEASKRAVQSAAEEEIGQFFNAICGTGFFSYIAHTDEFCLASMFGVNCYLFSPVCSDTSTTIFAKLRKSHKKVHLNRN
uniref:Ground-like domain-containing protein n=1 Tax=Angiostrongylus cantonensis TaxID=6313 RepID=A0A0K0DI04_ANGCA